MRVKRTKVATPARTGRGRLATTASSTLSLPDKPHTLSTDLRSYSMLVHGEKKIGKTSLLAQEPDAIFLEFDPLQQALAIYQVQIPTWADCKGYVKLLEAESKKVKPRFKTVVVDGVEIMYRLCFEAMCREMGIEHPHDEKDYGKSWGRIKTEFSGVVHRLLNLKGIAPRFLCHSHWKEVKTRDGAQTEKLTPILSGQAEEILVGQIDIWAAYTYFGKDRVLIVQGDEEIGAGHRVDTAFKTPSGEHVVEIPMGKTSKEAYQNLLLAFNNKQTNPRVTAAAAPPKKLALKKKAPATLKSGKAIRVSGKPTR